MTEIKCDLHIHTDCTPGGESGIEEILKEAKSAKMELIATTDAFSAMAVSEDEELKSEEFFEEEIIDLGGAGDIMVMRGCEVDIVGTDGYLLGIGKPMSNETVVPPSEIMDTVPIAGVKPDFIIAGVKRKWGLSDITEALATRMYLNVLEDPRVLYISNLILAGIPFDVGEVFLRARELHKPIEIDEKSMAFSDDVADIYRDIAITCAENGINICVNSGSYRAADACRFPRTIAMLEEINFPDELIMNRSAQDFMQKFGAAGFDLA